MLTQRRSSIAIAIVVLSIAYTANATSVDLIATPFTGDDTSVRIALDDTGGDINVSLTVNEGLADLRGFFLNIADNSLLAGLSVTGDDVTDFDFDLDDASLIDMGNGNNLNGGGSPCPCDLAVSLGTPGIGKDDIFSTTFVISANAPLTLDLFSLQLVGVRVTSVGDEKGSREGSAKLGGALPEIVPVPEPTTAALVVLGLSALSYRNRRR